MSILKKRKLAIKNLYISIALISLAMVTYALPFVAIISAVIGLIYLMSHLYLSFKYWKCPACGEQFPVVYSRMDERKECWYCLAPLE